jgi:two-component system, cell cycle response regulator
VTASIGRAVWPVDGDGPEALLRRADAAMYDVKRSAHERAVAAS